MSGGKVFGVIYGAQGRSDYTVVGRFTTPEDAAASYDPELRVRYMDGTVGGASVVELDDQDCPVETVLDLASDESRD